MSPDTENAAPVTVIPAETSTWVSPPSSSLPIILSTTNLEAVFLIYRNFVIAIVTVFNAVLGIVTLLPSP